jgi:hypothetical protein
MTIETKMTIEFKDIVAIEFECPQCHTRTSRKLTENNHVPEKCRSGLCTHVFFGQNSLEYGELLHALNLIGRYAKAKDMPLAMRFELSGLPAKP